MNAVFADTSYWIALTNVQDADHERAEALSVPLKTRPVLTTELVLIEYLNYFAGWGPRLEAFRGGGGPGDDGFAR